MPRAGLAADAAAAACRPHGSRAGAEARRSPAWMASVTRARTLENAYPSTSSRCGICSHGRCVDARLGGAPRVEHARDGARRLVRLVASDRVVLHASPRRHAVQPYVCPVARRGWNSLGAHRAVHRRQHSRGIGVVGAVTLVGYRSNLKDPRDLIFAFAALGAGVAAGAHAFFVAIFGTALFVAGLCAVSRPWFGRGGSFDAILSLRTVGEERGDEALARELCIRVIDSP